MSNPVPRATCETPELPLCTRCYERPRRAASQRWCKPCHAAYVKGWRDEQRARDRAMKWELSQLRRQQQETAVA